MVPKSRLNTLLSSYAFVLEYKTSRAHTYYIRDATVICCHTLLAHSKAKLR